MNLNVILKISVSVLTVFYVLFFPIVKFLFIVRFYSFFNPERVPFSVTWGKYIFRIRDTKLRSVFQNISARISYLDG